MQRIKGIMAKNIKEVMAMERIVHHDD